MQSGLLFSHHTYTKHQHTLTGMEPGPGQTHTEILSLIHPGPGVTSFYFSSAFGSHLTTSPCLHSVAEDCLACKHIYSEEISHNVAREAQCRTF